MEYGYGIKKKEEKDDRDEEGGSVVYFVMGFVVGSIGSVVGTM